MMKSKLNKRILSAILCLAMLLPYIPGFNLIPAVSAASVSGMDPVTSSEVKFMDGIYYEIARTTRYNGNRTYTVQVDLSANLTHYDHARVRTASQNGYVTIEETGYYLLELWGGKGADGGIGLTGAILIPLPTPGGNGGAGGYVYGKVFLEEGQTLAFNIGTNGTKSTVYNDGSGGVNGDGGTHGEEGSYTVGAGGGYTAIYLFEKGEFNPSYVSEKAFNIPETARLNRHLMIAGGGGGGGAGLGGTLPTLADNGSPPSAPSGGAAGNINRGVSMTLTGDGYDVPGYVFSGRNGLSSGTDSSWVGRGGSNVPGAISSTLMGSFDATRLPNDWTGTYYNSSAPGAGGSGNFRGGGGGSGYAGGSGGLMKAQLLASHIGGGGGGSSFIAEEVNGKKIEFLDLTNEEKQYLSGAANQPVGASTGGAVQISYLKSAEDAFYEEMLDHVTLTGSVSKYFEIVESSCSVKETGTLSVNTLSDGSSTFTVSDLSIRPVRPNSDGKTARVTLRLRAKSEFMGGNSVPFVSGIEASFLSPNDKTTPLTFAPVTEIQHHTVNVPLLEKMQTKSYTSSTEGKSYATSSLYVDDYTTPALTADHRNNLSSYWYYDFVSAISTYSVWEYNKQDGTYTQVTSSTVAPTETTQYEVRYTVTPKNAADDAVKVGPAVANPHTVKGKAVISVVAPGVSVLNGLTVSGSKSLSFADGVYDFSVLINQQSATLALNTGTANQNAVGQDLTWEAPETGWYYVQAWGGNGGRGGYAEAHQRSCNAWCAETNSSSGGTGGYVASYVYLTAGQVLTYTVGAVGSNGANRSNTLSSSAANRNNWTSASGGGGGAGSPSTVSLDSTLILSAGGGGGGAGSMAYVNGGANIGVDSTERQGAAGQSVTTTVTDPAAITTASSGTAGYYTTGTNWLSQRTVQTYAGSRGTAGNNYDNPAFGTAQNGQELSLTGIKIAQNLSTARQSSAGGNGQISITLLESPAVYEAMESVCGVKTEVAFSRYFDLNSVTMKSSQTGTATTTQNADGSYTVVYNNSSLGEVARFTYAITTAEDGVSSNVKIWDCEYAPEAVVSSDKTSLHYTSSIQFNFNLTPKEGFLGGNDVPVLAYGQTGNQPDTHDGYADYGVKITQGDEFMNLLASDPTDYANVETEVDLSQYLTVRDKTVRLGDTVNKSDLYTFTPPVYGTDAWEDDFVTFKAPEERTWQPTATEEVPVTVSFAPITDPAQKATIVESVVPQEFTLDATVYVEVPVTNTLTNLTSDHADWTLWGEDFACNITAKDGYILPEEITVTIGGAETENYTYNSSLGTLAIEGQYVTGPIVIGGKADVKTYDIHFVYAEYDAEAGEQIRTKVYTGIVADTVIDWSDIDAIAAAVPEKEGYTYVLSYDVDGGLRPETMPANNLWVYGSYTKAEYLLEIEYVYENGTQAAEPYKNYVVFGDEYNVPSPAAKKGYLPDKTVISGVMGTTAVKETVTYHPSVNTLLILHQKADGSLLKSESHQMVTDQEYSIAVEKIEGYTPDRETVTGKMQGNESETVVVIHTPEQYTVTFDYKSGEYADATMDGEPRLVEYGRNYGYNATEKLHDGLPTPQLAGYTFVGWYKEATLENQVKDTDMVEIGDRTFYAKWERTKFKLTIRYEFLYEDGDYLPTKPDSEEFFESKDAVQAHLTDDVVEIPFGEAYSVDLPALTGYSSYRNFGLNDQEKLTALTGTMPGQNRLVLISFQINTYEIKFADLPGQHVTYSDGDTSTDDVDSFDTLWQTVYVKHNVVPVYTGVEPAHDTRAQYTYAFTGWYGSNDSKFYPGKTPVFPAATGERNYYATYTATENIISVSHGTTVKYFTEVAPALEYAETNIASSVTMTFRRNNGNEPVLNLDGDTLTFGNTYTGTTSYPLTVDLNGITLQTTDGESVVKNTVSPIRLTLRDSGTGGAISASGDGNVVAIDCTTGSLTVNNAISVTARSASGNATALHSGDTVTLGTNVSLSARADNGIAVGLDVAETSTVNAAKISADGKEAIGIRVADGASVTLTGSVLQMNVNGADSAKGIALQSGASLVNTVLNSNEQKINASGDAYGIYNEGTLSSVNLKMTVEAGENAYGLYNNAGTVTTAGIGAGTDLRATGKEGYGLYNAENGTAIGSADGDKLSKGAFAGSSYGIYSADDSIYASGNFVYFKGADEESALLGVVHAPYDQVDATTQFEAGYYRLAAMRTLEFVTNGGTEIETVKQYYDTPLDPVETKRSGYTFVDWHKTETLDSVYKLPATMPDEDLTLYAQWNLNQYQYALDTEIREYTIKFYQNKTSTDTSLFGEVVVNNERPTLTAKDIPVEDPTYISGTTLYIFNGWYTQRTDTSATYVNLNGDLADLDTDGDCIIELYAGWESMGSAQSFISFDTKESSAYVTGSHSSSKNYRMYFVVPADGDYSVSVGNVANGTSTSYQKDLRIYTYKHGTKSSEFVNSYTNAGTALNYVDYKSSSYSGLRGLKAGDVIVVQLYYRNASSTYNSTVYSKISSVPATYNDVANYKAYSSEGVNPIDYNVEMGTVQLPLKEADAEHEDMKFAGWADTENAPKEDRIMQITPDMVDTVEEWQNGQLWQLYSQWTERIWDVYQSGKRDFTVFENASSVSIRANGTVSLRFKSEQSSDEPVRFVFEKGLPAGTLLTLIDRSAAVPVYYTYTATGTVKELASTDFVRMGASAISFSGIGSDLVLQICYQNAAVSAGSEKVSIYAGDIVPEVDADYSVKATVSQTVSGSSHSFPYTDQHTLNVTIPSATGLGLPDDYKVFLRVRWDGVNLAPGTEIKLGDVPAVIYNGDYAMLDTGLTVADMTSSTTAQVHIYMPTMVQNEFADKTFYYELCIAPDTSAAFGKQVETVLTVTEVLSLQETPSLTVDAVEKTAAVGEEISVTVNSADAEFYLVQQNGDGTFQSNANCSALFNALTVASDGKLSLADSDLVTDGVFTATLSANAPVGKYYLLVKLGDKYERILLKVTAA